MEFIVEVVPSLRGTTAKVQRFVKITRPPHLAPFPTSYTSMGLESMQKWSSLPSIWLAMRLRICSQRLLHRLAAVVELTAGDKVGNRGTTLLQLRLKQPVLAVYLLYLSGHTQGDDFRIRETRHRTGSSHISSLSNQIFGEELAYLQEFDELCIQVAHNEIVKLNNFHH